MWWYVIVEGSTTDRRDLFGNCNYKNYICYVSYSSIQGNVALIKDYFRYYCGFDFDNLKSWERPPIDDYNCVMAILAYYFRDKSLIFKYKEFKFSCHDEFPRRDPEKATNQYKVWVDTVETRKITTPKSAAWMLYETVAHGKISVDHAKILVKERFPEHLYNWDRIMNEFSKYGGRHTKKYIQRL